MWNFGSVPSRDMQTPQFCSHFHERCTQCWIEWKTIFRFLDSYFSSYRENASKINSFDHKNDHISDWKSQKSENGFFFRFIIFCIFHVNFNTFNFFHYDACDLMHTKWRDYCEVDYDANQFRLGRVLNPNHAGSRGAASVGVVGNEAPHHFILFQ